MSFVFFHQKLNAKLLWIFFQMILILLLFLIPICSLFCGWPISFPKSSMTKHILNNNNLEKSQKISQIGINLGAKTPRKKNSGGAQVSPENNKTGLFCIMTRWFCPNTAPGMLYLRTMFFLFVSSFQWFWFMFTPNTFLLRGGEEKMVFLPNLCRWKTYFSGCGLNFKNSKSSWKICSKKIGSISPGLKMMFFFETTIQIIKNQVLFQVTPFSDPQQNQLFSPGSTTMWNPYFFPLNPGCWKRGFL